MITKLNFTDRTIKSYAIRKLTPKECFRLMGVRDNVIGTMQSSNAQAAERLPDWKGKGKPEDMAISASQQYKQAGNSIVVDVLAHIYEQLFYPKPNQRKFRQLSLFTDTGDYLPDMPKNLANSGKEKIFLTTFSGYDSQLMAADLLKSWHPDFRWTCVGWSDIDKYACQMHNLVFPQFADLALGDITKIDWHEVKRSLEGREVDLFTYSSPCQDISQAGKQMGLQEGSDTPKRTALASGRCRRGASPEVSLAGERGGTGKPEIHARLSEVARQTLVARLCEPLGATQRQELWCATKPRSCVLHFHAQRRSLRLSVPRTIRAENSTGRRARRGSGRPLFPKRRCREQVPQGKRL